MQGARLRVIEGRSVPTPAVAPDPWRFQADCADAYVRSWVARGFSPVTVENATGVLERMLAALGRPSWEVTADDVDRGVGATATDGRAGSTHRDYVQVFKGFHRFLTARKAVEIESAFGARLVCPVDEFNASRHVGDDSAAEDLIVTRGTKTSSGPASTAYLGNVLDAAVVVPKHLRSTRLLDLAGNLDPKLVAAAFGMDPEDVLPYLVDRIDPTRMVNRVGAGLHGV